MLEPSDEEMEQLYSDAIEELFEDGVFGAASCLLCGNVWMPINTQDGPCTRCFGHPAIAAEITLEHEDGEDEEEDSA